MPMHLDLSSLAAAYRSGSLTPLDVVDAVFARLASTPHDAVFIHAPDHERARSAARAVMERKARGDAMRLYGVPFAVKDNIDVAGLPTTAACPAFAYEAQSHAASVERLLAEGAILIGKTNLDQFATGLVGMRSPYGVPENPFDAARVPGGSSSGSAVAVARRFCSFALATDTAGSGRVPAGFNDLVGLKPTRGMISAHGVVPACRSLDCVAVLAANVADAAEVAHVLAGFDVRDPYARRAAAAWDPRPGPTPDAFRFAVPSSASLDLLVPYTPSLFRAAIERVERLGGTKHEIDLGPFTRIAGLLYGGPFVAERLEASGPLLARDPGAFDPTVRTILSGAVRHDAVDLFRSLHAAQQLRTQCERLWDEVDVMLVPTAPTLPRVADVQAAPLELNARLGTYTNFVNLLDLCALAIPAGRTEEGLPFGVTLIAPAGRDAALASLGHALQLRATPDAAHAPQQATATGPSSASSSLARLAVVGAHLAGEPLNHQLTARGARLVRAARTAPKYRLFALPTTPPKPGLVRVRESEPGHTIEVETWELTEAALGSFLREVAAPLCIGTLELDDGSKVLGFLCETAATEGQRDISSFGGWRAFRRCLA